MAASAPLINCFLINSRSLVKKLHVLDHFIITCKPDILFITETWLNSSVCDSTVIHQNNYSIIRKDRDQISNIRGGGILIFINNKLNFLPLSFSSIFEMDGIDLFINDNIFRFVIFYRPPKTNSAVTVQMFDELNNCFNQPSPFQPNHLICLGDFNLPKINWVNGCPTPTSNTNIEKRIITFTKTL
uniref:Endonuclease/exonuclease/phosphatase domain-containing protein n=1 Tax=Panagrolaimus sp. PS1159 TaxID=55785 RepID=A0AC35FGR8_9BILA